MLTGSLNAISRTIHWEGEAEHAYLVSPDLLSPEKHFIVIVDALANGVSTSLSNSETQAHGEFPQITITEMVVSQHRLLTEVLDIQSIRAVVGLSMGTWRQGNPMIIGSYDPSIQSPCVAGVCGWPKMHDHPV